MAKETTPLILGADLKVTTDYLVNTLGFKLDRIIDGDSTVVLAYRGSRLMLKAVDTPENFRDFHPGGRLGARLSRVSDLMHGDDAVPLVQQDAPMSEALLIMTQKGFGVVGVIDAAGRLQGIVTDGDLRRLVETGRDLRALVAHEVMHPNPRHIRDDALAAEAAESMEKHRITVLLVLDAAGRLVGAVNSNDLMRAKVI